MKNYIITVNGTSYEVAVEEVGTENVKPTPAPVKTQAPKAQPKPEFKNEAKTTSRRGNIPINAPMPGKILAVKTEIKATVKKGDVLFVLEAMKMENEIVAPEGGIVASINAAVGDLVEVNAILATLN